MVDRKILVADWSNLKETQKKRNTLRKSRRGGGEPISGREQVRGRRPVTAPGISGEKVTDLLL